MPEHTSDNSKNLLSENPVYYAHVKLLNGWDQTLTYRIPAHLSTHVKNGHIVRIPIQKRIDFAYVLSIKNYLTARESTYELREIIDCDIFINNLFYQKFMNSVHSYYALESHVLYKRLVSFLSQKENTQTSTNSQEDLTSQKTNSQNITLTDKQEAIVADIKKLIDNKNFIPNVLHGVTGSGKTEVYDALIQHAIANNKTVILLLPEVTLALQFTKIFKARYNTTNTVFGFHSGTSVKEKRLLWQKLRAPHDKISGLLIIGVHLPILLPIQNLGLIIIDEEHVTGYQEKSHPKLNSKEIALLRAQIYDIPIVLGSATPSVQTLYNVTYKNWRLHTLNQRFAGAFPKIQIVQLGQKQTHKNKSQKNSFWLSPELIQSIKDTLGKKEQVIIFLNRRGHSFFMQCAQCGTIVSCGQCSVSLTYHANNTLCCHYCGHTQNSPELCPACQNNTFLKKGIGTQQIVSLLQDIFPNARIARADLDTKKKNWELIVEKLNTNQLDILVGTQTVTKGYHFANVTLVGIIWADIHLGLPAYNAAEITLQQLIQVAGRAGRCRPDSLVIVQTMIKHELFNYLNESNYQNFYTYELNYRKKLNYPPYTRFAEIEIRNTCEQEILQDIKHIKQKLDFLCNNQLKDKTIVILGPTEPLVSKIKNVHIRKIYFKTCSLQPIISAYKQLKLDQEITSQLFFTPNPLSL